MISHFLIRQKACSQEGNSCLVVEIWSKALTARDIILPGCHTIGVVLLMVLSNCSLNVHVHTHRFLLFSILACKVLSEMGSSL